MNIPKQYLPVMPYIIVDDAKAFQQFTQDVFDAEEQLIVPADDGKIRHGELRIGQAVIMFANSHDRWQEKTCGMYIHVSSVDDCYARALKAGAKDLMPPVQQEYGYTAGFDDPFGNQWWVVQA